LNRLENDVPGKDNDTAPPLSPDRLTMNDKREEEGGTFLTGIGVEDMKINPTSKEVNLIHELDTSQRLDNKYFSNRAQSFLKEPKFPKISKPPNYNTS
jgi:hypothetical protein